MHSITLDTAAMLALWKRAHGYEPSRTDSTVTRVDGPDIDSLLTLEMRQWYIKALMELPPHMLPLSDIASLVTPVASPLGAASVTLPEGCLRVISVSMSHWHRPVAAFHSPDSTEALAQANIYARGGNCRPIAVLDQSTLTLIPDGGEVTRLLCVMTPNDDSTFILTPAMLSTLRLATSILT